jgi:hypothetical protein
MGLMGIARTVSGRSWAPTGSAPENIRSSAARAATGPFVVI